MTKYTSPRDVIAATNAGDFPAPHISVVIPLFDKEKHIHQTIQSVLNQTYPHWELVIVDDGSTDASPQVVEAFTDPRIRLIRQECNKGVSVARNRGVEETKYDWVAFLDADDEWRNDFLETLLFLMEKYPGCNAYATSYEYFHEKTRRMHSPPTPHIEAGWHGIIEDYFWASSYSSMFYTSSIVVQKEVLQDIGGFPPHLSHGEDLFVWVNLTLKYKICFINLPKSIYHIGISNQLTSQPSDHAIIDWLLDQWHSGFIPEKLIPGYKEYILNLLYVSIHESFLQHQDGATIRKLLKMISDNKLDSHRLKNCWYFLWSYATSGYTHYTALKSFLRG